MVTISPKNQASIATIFVAMMVRMTITVVFCTAVSEHKWLTHMHQLMSFLLSQILVVFSLWSKVHSVTRAADPPQAASLTSPNSLSFATVILIWQLFHHECITVLNDTQSVAFHSCFPRSSEVESFWGFWQLSEGYSLNLWPEETLQWHLEVGKFLTELPMWIIYNPRFLKDVQSFFTVTDKFCWSDTT